MKSNHITSICAASILIVALAVHAGNGDSAVRAWTPAGGQVIARLERARKID